MVIEKFSLFALEGAIANARVIHVEGDDGRSLWAVEFETRGGSVDRLTLKRGGVRLFRSIDAAVKVVFNAGYRGDFVYSLFR